MDAAHPTSPHHLSPDVRLSVITDILAISVLRAVIQKNLTADQLQHLNNISETTGEGLALFRQQSVHTEHN